MVFIMTDYLSSLDSMFKSLRQVLEFFIEIYRTAKLNNLSLTDFGIISFILLNSCTAIFWLWKKYKENENIQEGGTQRIDQVQNLHNGGRRQQIEKNLEEQLKRHFEGNSKLHENILKKNLTEENILSNSVEDLIDELNITDKKDIEKFSKMRVALRVANFEKRDRIIIEEKRIQNLEWDEVCQLVEEQFKPASQKQRLSLYTYIERNNINGLVLLNKKEKDLIKKLDLNEGQTAKFKALLEKIKEEKQNKGGVSLVESHVGVINQGNQNKYNNISLGTPHPPRAASS